jgi:hypothetical protein
VPQNRASFRKFLVHMNPESHQENFPWWFIEPS